MMRFGNTGLRAGVFMLLLSILILVLPLAAYGEGGDGTGNPRGVFKPLGLVSATLEDGTGIIDAENVPLQPKITMRFDKNVVYLIYWERNKRCFHLYDEDGRKHELILSKIDETVDFSKRQYIWVEPAESLAPGTRYTLYVAPDLLAKNGGSILAMTTNNQGLRINFRTAGEKTVQIAPPVLPEENTAATSTAGSKGPAPEAKPATANASLIASSPDTSRPGPETSGSPDGSTARSSDSPATGEPDSGTATAQSEAAPTVPAEPAGADEARFAELQRGRKMQNYAAISAVILLAGWVAVEVIRRKK
jgi:hypothetical protein